VNKIYWRTPSKSLADGYGYSSYKIRESLMNDGMDIIDTSSIESRNSKTITKTLYISMESGLQFEPEMSYDGVLINNSLPDQYIFDAEYVIGFTYWETDKIPGRWLSNMERCDELWTTSSWAAGVFKEQFPNKIVKNFDLGIDTSVFNINDDYKNDDPFYFMHIGSPSSRKNTQLAVDAFRKVFENDSRFKMIIKSVGPPDARNFVNGNRIGSLYSLNNFEIIDNIISIRDLNFLYERAHCLVYPTSGEGWGMIPFQSIAKGIPTICTDATACSEFAKMGIPLKYQWSSYNTHGIYRGGQWAEPDFDDICDKMYYVATNYEEVRNRAIKNAKIVQEKYSWDVVGKKYKERLCQILNQ